MDKHGHFVFICHDYDSSLAADATGIAWHLIQKRVESMPCPVLLVMDTCHSGTITSTRFQGNSAATRSLTMLDDVVERAVQSVAHSERGLAIFAASLSRDEALERPDWCHGALTVALLEGIA